MICPVCKGVFHAGVWKDTITYECNEHCTKLVYENDQLKAYVLTQKINDDKNSDLKYKIMAVKSAPKTMLFHLDFSNSAKPLLKPVLTLQYFINITTQEELDGLINRLLNLKAFS